jgi:hypothetical protein
LTSADVTLLAPGPSVAKPLTFPAAASTGVSGLLCGQGGEGVVLGAGRSTVWIDLGFDCLVIEMPGGARLPNAVVAALTWDRAPSPGAGVRVGDGRLLLEDTTLRVVRWWDPRPVVPSLSVAGLARSVAHAAGIETPSDRGLELALARRDPGAVMDAAEGLVGKGGGLTPEGDDLLAGALAGLVLLGEAVGDYAAVGLVEGLEAEVSLLARERTTLLSACLLTHACAGRVAASVAGLLSALGGRGEMGSALARLAALGHSSGRALAGGTLTAARAITGGPA